MIFAEMRTGSNHLEESLKAIDGIALHGEVFNPVFVGGPKVDTLFGHDLASRERDPLPLLRALQTQSDGLPGFRFFHDHDPRVFEAVLSDPRVGKIILTRNPLEAYVSLKIAAETGQWRLTNAKKAKSAQIDFAGPEFDEMVARLQDFQTRILRGLQTTGQTAFYINYEDIGDLDVVNGIAAFLGVEGRLAEMPGKLKRQNPGALDSKVRNVDAMHAHLTGLDPFQLSKTPNFEPPRGPAVPQLVAAAQSPLLHVPIQGGPSEAVEDWLGALDGQPPLTGFSQKTLRPWMRKSAPFTAFTILRHPLERAHHVFCTRILPEDTPGYQDIRKVIMQQYGVPIPRKGPDADYTPQAHRAAFLGFLGFLKSHLNDQGSLRVDAAFATQLAIVQGVANVVPPQRIVREDAARQALAQMARDLGKPAPDFAPEMPGPFALADIHDRALEDEALEAYRKDYLTFGFKRWDR